MIEIMNDELNNEVNETIVKKSTNHGAISDQNVCKSFKTVSVYAFLNLILLTHVLCIFALHLLTA